MAETNPTLIAIGGGGATHGTQPELDRLCLTFVGDRPRMGYIGTASGDDPEKYQRFLAGFQPFAADISELPSDANSVQARAWADDLDVIYVGGGNPVLLVDHWNATSIGSVLSEAARHGTILAGVSAGAMCWFESFLWRSDDESLQVSKGLGLVKGAMTPHSLTQPDRRVQMRELVASGAMPEGYVVDDGAALVVQGSDVQAFPPIGPPHVYRICRARGETLLGA